MTALTGAAGVFDSAQNYIGSLSSTLSAPLNFPVNGPIFVAVMWRIGTTATATVTDNTAGNIYQQQLKQVTTDTPAHNSVALFLCPNPTQPWDGSTITVKVTMSVPVNNLFICPFTVCLPKTPLIIASTLLGVSYNQNTQALPSIAMNLPDSYDTVVALCYGNGANVQTVTPGWKVIQQSANGHGVFRIVPAASGAFSAQPCSYTTPAPGNVMIVFAMAPTPNLNVSVDQNGKMLPAGITVLRPFGDTLSSLLADPGWTYSWCPGMTIRMQWSDIQPNAPTGDPALDYNWSYIDGALAQAQSTGKFIGLIMGMGALAPVWLLNSSINLFDVDQGTGLVPAPWDVLYQQILQNFITALAARYDSNPNLAYISTAGFGAQTGMGLCRSDNDNNELASVTYNGQSGLNLLYGAFQTVCQMWMSAFQKTRLMVVFYSPLFPNQTQNETTIALPWMQWLLSTGPMGQIGTKYNNWNVSLAPLQDVVPAQLVNSIRTTGITGAQPQHAAPTDWPAVFQNAVSWGCQFIEGYGGQVAGDGISAPGGANWQYTCMMLLASAGTTQNFTPFVPPPSSGNGGGGGDGSGISDDPEFAIMGRNYPKMETGPQLIGPNWYDAGPPQTGFPTLIFAGPWQQ